MKLITRIRKIRSHKTITFLETSMEIGTLQVVLKKELHHNMKSKLNVGDVVKIKGMYGYTESKQYSLFAEDVHVLARPDHVIPFNGQSHNRTEELLLGQNLKLLKSRFSILNDIRNHFVNLEFTQVETPILHPLFGGASAVPFEARCRAVEKNVFLRVSPELYLKRFIIAGVPKVFEIGKVFRNECLDKTHHPEFTICEAYQCDSTLSDWMEITKSFLKEMFTKYLEFSPPVVVLDSSGFDAASYESLVEEETSKYPDSLVFVMGSPKRLTPLAKQGFNGNNEISVAFEVYYNSVELINCYEEENDAIQQETKFREYLEKCDEDYLKCLRLGMPPTTGWGLGVDRLVMLLTKTDRINKVLPFPLRGRK
eukprot:NODE_534_length_7054_cov_0.303666.p2 type:complete len:368 gc:universal NODE_534_length_7054_cov_0.303666:5564-6667(+)